MRLHTLRIRNFRCFDDVLVVFEGYTCLVGANGAGKSTVLAALNVLFRERDNASTDTSWLDAQDFHKRDTSRAVQITATFVDLPKEAVEELSDYVRHGQLVVSAIAEFDTATQRAEVRQAGERLGMAAFAPFFRAQNNKEKVERLREIYEQIRGTIQDLPPPGSGPAMLKALQEYEAARQEQCVLLRSDDEFYGATKGKGKLDRFVQWVYIPAVKDARHEQSEGRGSALGKLIARTVRTKTKFDEQVKQIKEEMTSRYQKLLDSNQGSLDQVSKALGDRVKAWAHPATEVSVQWIQDAEKAIKVEEPIAKAMAGETGFVGDLARLGHGLQRSFILAVLQELALSDDANQPTLILGCEEPELYQHPPQARHLASIMADLSQANSQIVVSTHSTHFVSGLAFEQTRLVRKDAKGVSTVHSAQLDAVSKTIATWTGKPYARPEGMRARIHQAMLFSAAEMFFGAKVLIVEGVEDVAYLTTHFCLRGVWDEMRSLGMVIVPASCKSRIVELLAICRELSIPAYAVWDGDDHETHKDRRPKHENDNRALHAAVGSNAGPFTQGNVTAPTFATWQTELSREVKNDLGGDWEKYHNQACNACGDMAEMKKNVLYVAELLAEAHAGGGSTATLDNLTNQVMTFVHA